MQPRLLPVPGTFRVWIRGFLLTLSFVFLTVTLAGPKFGETLEVVTQNGTDLMILLDTSESMMADDVQPSRIENAKLDIEDLLTQMVGDRVGLVAFAGKPVVVVPLTSDQNFFRSMLQKVDTRTAPVGGTAIGDAIRLAIKAIPVDSKREQAIILITDGEDHESMPLEAAADAAKRGIKIYPVAIGDTVEGSRIPVFDANGKKTGYKKYHDEEVWSKADVKLLQEIAKTTDGVFIPAGVSSYDLGKLYVENLSPLKRDDYMAETRKCPKEQYQLFLFPGILCLILYLTISPYKSRQPILSEIRRGTGIMANVKKQTNISRPRIFRWGPGHKMFLIGTIFSCGFLLLPGNIPGEDHISPEVSEEPSVTSPAENISTNIKKEEPGNVDEKLVSTNEFERYNDACQLLADKNFDQAERVFKTLLNTHNKKISASIQYNLGFLEVEKIRNQIESLKNGDGDSEIPVENDSAKVDKKQKPEDSVTVYERERKSRDQKRAAILEVARNAENYFFAAAQYSEFKKEARRNIDILRNWKRKMIQEWDQQERNTRNEKLNPPEHFQWMENRERAVRSQILKNDSPVKSPAFFHEYDKCGKEIDGLRDDLEQVAGKIKADILQTGNSSDDDTASFDRGVEQLDRLLLKSAELLEDHETAEINDSLKNTIELTNLARTSLIPYQELLTESIELQKQIVKDTERLSVSVNDKNQHEIIWDSDFIKNWTLALTAKASMEFLSKKINPEEVPDDADIYSSEPGNRLNIMQQENPESEETGQNELLTEQTSEEDSLTESQSSEPDGTKEQAENDDLTDREVLSETDSTETGHPGTDPSGFGETEQKNGQQTPGGQSSPEEKLHRSMRRALTLGPKIIKQIPEVQTALEKSEIASAVSLENEILKMLEKIAEPLQDENQQNDQNKNDSSQEQQDQNQSSEKNQQENSDDSQNNHSDENKDDGQSNPQDQQNDSEQNNSEQNDPPNNQEDSDDGSEQESDSQEDNADDKKNPADDKEELENDQAEAMFRKVRQRQQNAQEMRQLVEQYKRRREKVDKDW